MTQLAREWVVCPQCGTGREQAVICSLSGDRAPAAVADILAHRLELTTCEECDARFQPEHRLLYADVPRRQWIVMYPRSQQPHFLRLEHSVAVLFEREFARAPGTLADKLAMVRPRLVFGHHMLAEAIRAPRHGLDPTVVECVKLLIHHRRPSAAWPRGTSEPCYEGANLASVLRFGVYSLASGTRVAQVRADAEWLAEVAAREDEFRHHYSELFSKPYLSASRYFVTTSDSASPTQHDEHG